MSITNAILERMMNEPDFADTVFADAEKALAEYNLTAGVLEKFKSMSRAEFKTISTEERKTLASDGRSYVTGYFALDLDGV